MTRRGFLVLLALTVVAVGIAAWVTLANSSGDRLRFTGETAFPELEKRLEAVRGIEVTTASGKFRLSKQNGTWVAASHYGYPVKQERVNRLHVSMADLELIAAKTARPDLYGRIGVSNPTAKGAVSRRVTLRDAKGDSLADLIVGKQRHIRTGRRDQGTYVRRPGEARAYLAAGLVDLSDEIYPWLQSEIIDLDPERVRRVEIMPDQGQRLLAIRPDPGAPAMGIAGLPQGARPDIKAIKQLPDVLRGVRFDAVQPFDAPGRAPRIANAEIETFDGLIVQVTVYRRLNTPWITLNATSRDHAAPHVINEAKALNKAVSGWQYKVADYLSERFSQSLTNVIQ